MEFLFWLVFLIFAVVEMIVVFRDMKKTNIAMKRRDENIERIAKALENRIGE